jgi:arylsulfatase A-like enzyme
VRAATPPPFRCPPVRLITALFASALTGTLAPVPAGAASPSVAKPPNVLFILADDLGWGDLRCYGNPHIDTPALDALAQRGVRFTDHYTPSSLCAPARAGYLTGRYNHRTGAVDVPSNRGLDRLDAAEKTFGDYFRHAGYSTALIGKWHNGLYHRDHLPHRRGFDSFYGFPNGGQDYWKWNLLRNDDAAPHDGRYLSDALNDETIALIRRPTARPFAIFLAHHAPHSPLQAPAALVKKYRERLGPKASEAVVVTYAMIEAMDAGLARVFQSLKDEGLWEQTIIVFTSDNGPVLRRDPELGSQLRFNGVFSGEKESVLEGGIRVPGIVAWPGRIPGGRVETTPVHGCDWLPTLFSLTGKSAPTGAKPIDGLNLMPLLEGKTVPALAERPLLFQRNRYAPVRHANAAIREGRWKLYWPGDKGSMVKDSGRDNPSYRRGLVRPHWEMPLDVELAPPPSTPQPAPRLHDLAADPGEQRDLAAAHPEIVAALARKHDAWFEEVQAEWKQSRARIVAADLAAWHGRPAPDPAALFRDFWQWNSAPKGTDPKSVDPLQVFPGYWSTSRGNRKSQ